MAVMGICDWDVDQLNPLGQKLLGSVGTAKLRRGGVEGTELRQAARLWVLLRLSFGPPVRVPIATSQLVDRGDVAAGNTVLHDASGIWGLPSLHV